MRMCACHTTEGFVHLSCLVRQAEIAVADDMSNEDMQRMSRWHRCRLCGSSSHGFWRTLRWGGHASIQLGRPEPSKMTLKILSELGADGPPRRVAREREAS